MEGGFGTWLLLAIGLWLILEGLLPFFNPKSFRAVLQQILELGDNTIRWIGFFAINLGALIIYLVNF